MITSSLIPGEDPVTITSTNLGVTNQVTSAAVLARGDVVVTVAQASINTGAATPSFALPSDLLDASGVGSDDRVALLATDWALNPYVKC